MFRLLLVSLLLLPSLSGAAELGVEAVDALVPRRIKLSIAAERSWISVDSRLWPKDVGVQDWSTWDRDRSGAIEPAERPALLADLERMEAAHLSVSIDGEVLPVTRLTSKLEAADPQAALPLDARLTLRMQTQWRQTLAAGPHRITLYDQPRSDDGVVPFRVSFGRGLTLTGGAGARAEIKGRGQRVDVATTKLSPIFWGSFVRADEAK